MKTQALISRGVVAALFLVVGSAFAAPSQLHVSGSKLYNSSNAAVRLQGANIPSLEWTNTGENISGSQSELHNVWKAVLIRLPLSQDRWFGKASGQSDGGANYRSIVDSVVNTASSGGYYVLLDLHWSDGGVWGANIGQHRMPDNNSTTFWQSCAARYKNNPAVLFDLYNEPHSVTWPVWRNGGSVSDTNSYSTPGMQALLNTVRGTGANNVVVAGGLNWAYDLTGIANGYALSETSNGKGIIYAAHVYPSKSNWDSNVTVAASAHCIIISEVGADTSSVSGWTSSNVSSWCNTAISWINGHNYHWCGWAFHPKAGPCMITDFSTYTPTTWGQIAKNQLATAKLP